MLLEDIGEHKLLKIINKYCDRTKNGDDAAVMSIDRQKQLIVTTDVLVENNHFSKLTTPPKSIGYRAITANLSDIAAMGGMPIGVTVGLSLRDDVEVSWLEEIYQGMVECLQPYGVGIIGGDTTKSQTNTIAITALGEVAPEQIIYRHQAQVGDAIVITGKHGLSKAGLEILLNGEKYRDIDETTKAKLIYYHQYPQPRLDIIKKLWALPTQFSIAGMDSSDGLADAILQICQQSNVGAKLDLTKIIIANQIKTIVDRKTALDWVFYGGEDFELVLCLPLSMASKLKVQSSADIQIIGEIIPEKNVYVIDTDNQNQKFFLSQKETFQHF